MDLDVLKHLDAALLAEIAAIVLLAVQLGKPWAWLAGHEARIRAFAVVATHPTYQLQSGDQDCPPDFSGCDLRVPAAEPPRATCGGTIRSKQRPQSGLETRFPARGPL